MSRHLGLLIGVSHYQDSTFRPLQFAENDARALAQWLVNTRGGKWSPPDVQLVQGQHATRELIQSLITQICVHKAEPGDVVFLYFSGHAFIDERTGEGYLALANSQYRDPSSCVSLTSLAQQVLTRSTASQILCVLDCFQSGPVWERQRTTPYDSKPLLGTTVMSLLQQQKNRLFLCSCRGNTQLPERGERNLGMLAHRMILGLSGPASESATGNVTLPKLHAYLFNSLDEQHRPQLFGQQQSPMILVGDPSAPPSEQKTGGQPLFAHATTPSGIPSTPSSGATGGLLKNASNFTRMASAKSTQQLEPSATSATLDTQTTPQQAGTERLLEQAKMLFQAQNYGEAFELTEQILQTNPRDTGAFILKGQLLGTAGRFPEALATIDQLLQVDPNHALGWSMRAVALSNIGQHQSALTAIERSLELDAQNPETYGIKNTIMSNLASASPATNEPIAAPRQFSQPQQESAPGFASDFGTFILGLVMEGAGALALLFLQGVLGYVALLISSLGLAIMCVSVYRGAYRSGISRLALPLITTVLIGGMLGAAYKFGQERILDQVTLHPNAFVPFILLVIWLVATAILPLLSAMGGFLFGINTRRRQSGR